MRTSLTDPLRIDAVATSGAGQIGMTFCPGKQQTHVEMGHWSRDLMLDLSAIRDWGAVAVVTLMEDHELVRYRVSGLGDAVQTLGMQWFNLPIPDVDVPELSFERLWQDAGSKLRTHLLAGQKVLLHCRGGLGRTGMIAARLLAELGVPPPDAIRRVRKARPGTIETGDQEDHVLRIRAIS